MVTGEQRAEVAMKERQETERKRESTHGAQREHNKDSKTNTDQERRMRSCPCLCVHMAKRAGGEKDQHIEISPFAQASF